MPRKGASVKSEEGLPREAFAIIGDPEERETWKLPHHAKSIYRTLAGKLNIERTVDWERMSLAVAALSLVGRRRQVEASPEETIEAAKHLADHYRKAGKPLPDTLAALA